MAEGSPNEACVVNMADSTSSRYYATYQKLSEFNYNIDEDQENLESDQPWMDSLYLTLNCDKNASGVTFIHLAAFRGDLKLLKLVVGVHTDSVLDATDEFGRCALHFAAHQGHHEIIEWLLQQSAEQPHPQTIFRVALTSRPLQVDTVARSCTVMQHVDTVRLLVKKKADLDVVDRQGRSPLLMAHRGVLHIDSDSKCQYEQIVDILVSNKARLNVIDPQNKWSALHFAVELNSIGATKSLLECCKQLECYSEHTSTPLHIAATHGYNEILFTLLGDVPPEHIDSLDECFLTPLHVAALRGNLEGVRALVDKGGNLAEQTRYGDTVINLLRTYTQDSNLVEFFTDMLDAKVRLSEKMKGSPYKGYIINLDFGILAPRNQPQMAVVSAMMNALPKNMLTVILQHPLLKIYLEEQFLRVRWPSYIGIVCPLIFVLILCWYTVVLVGEDTEYATPRRILLVFSSIELCSIFWQFFRNPRHSYTRIENWLGLTCGAILVAVTLAGEYGKASWILHSVGAAILLCWIRITLSVGRLPICAFWALIFFTVLTNVLKVFSIGLWIILGFTLSFCIVFHDTVQFENPFNTFVKTVVMMTGEYDYKSLFYPETTNNSTIPNSVSDVTGRITLVLFIIIASIVLMNLMIGLAVSDIQGLVREGQLNRLVKQAEFLIYCELSVRYASFSGHFVRKYMKKTSEFSRVTEKTEHTLQQQLWTNLVQLGLKNRPSVDETAHLIPSDRPAKSASERWLQLVGLVVARAHSRKETSRSKKGLIAAKSAP